MSDASPELLLNLLRNGTPHREVYKAADGTWWVTYGGGGPWPPATVHALASRGEIVPVYDDLPDACFHVPKWRHPENKS